MKKRNVKRLALGGAMILTVGLLLSGCGSSGSSGSSSNSFSATYDITGDYMTENPDTGELTVADTPSTPMDPDNDQAASVALGYAGSFGSFVDAVSVTATLSLDGDTYTYTIKDQCGTSDNGMGYYAPEYTWSGSVTSNDGGQIAVSAPTSASVTIHSEGQFATNEEMKGYFGEDGYSATEATTDCPYGNVPSGDALLSMFRAGTFTVDGSTLGAFSAQ